MLKSNWSRDRPNECHCFSADVHSDSFLAPRELEGSSRIQWDNSTNSTQMMKTIRLITMSRSPSRCGFFILAIALCWFALSPPLQAACSNVGDCGGQNTGVGPEALANFTTGVLNSAVGFRALFNNTVGSANTAIGEQALFNNVDGSHGTAIGGEALFNNLDGQENVGVGYRTLYTNDHGNRNTGMGYRTLAFNSDGNDNTAIGWNALYNNRTGGVENTAVGSRAGFTITSNNGLTAIGFRALQGSSAGSNTAVGWNAMENNTNGFNNVALGVLSLENNNSGQNNTAIGNLALDANTSGSNNVALGRHAGDGITTVNNNIVIGHLSGVHSRFGQVSDRCFIQNIYGAPVDDSGGVGRFVLIDPDGRLGTVFLPINGIDQGGFSPGSKQVIPQAATPDTALNGKVEKLKATVAQQEKQIKGLTAQLKEQAALIQKVSAQVQLKKPAPRTVQNNQ
jgi:hypothetical protein